MEEKKVWKKDKMPTLSQNDKQTEDLTNIV